MPELPSPLPDHLRPLRGALMGDDLRVAVTVDELRSIAAALDVLAVEHGNTLITQRDGSPWLEVDVVRTGRYVESWPPTPEMLARAKPIRLALWRYTLAVYLVGDDGAVNEDPIYRP